MLENDEIAHLKQMVCGQDDSFDLAKQLLKSQMQQEQQAQFIQDIGQQVWRWLLGYKWMSELPKYGGNKFGTTAIKTRWVTVEQTIFLGDAYDTYQISIYLGNKVFFELKIFEVKSITWDKLKAPICKYRPCVLITICEPLQFKIKLLQKIAWDLFRIPKNKIKVNSDAIL